MLQYLLRCLVSVESATCSFGLLQTVEAPTLSLLVPLLVRGLAERATAIRRKTAVIIDNMAKLVDSPHDAAVFLPRLLPGLKNMSNETADPEARSVAERAHKTMVRIGAEGEVSAPQLATPQVRLFLAALHCLLCLLVLRPALAAIVELRCAHQYD
jgi:hypothetical protein